jgi:hypothetical protein
VLSGGRWPVIDPHYEADVISSGRDGPELPRWRPPGWYLRAKSAVGRLSKRTRIVAITVLVCVAIGVTAAVAAPHRIQVTPHLPPPVVVVTALTRTAGASGVFARGTAGGRKWQLAVRDIADPGYQCQPGITLNGTDAVPVFPGVNPSPETPVGNPAFIVPGSWLPGAGFAFVQVPAQISRVEVDPAGVSPIQLTPVTVTVCGARFRLAGFGYPLASQLQIHANLDDRPAASYNVPQTLSQPQPSLADPQTVGIWQNLDAAHNQLASGTIAAGRAFGLPWSIKVTFGTQGDCFTLTTSYLDETTTDPRPAQVGICGPISTPQGPDTVVALPLMFPAASGVGTGFGISAGAGTSRLIAVLTGEGAFVARPVVVDGREYAAFFIPAPDHVIQLYWIAGSHTTTTTLIPQYGYTQLPG